ncbi:MAG: biotin synthase BioB [Verrucomicrobiota bacterium]|nr:biotin synthase BioB [Verrucomicrobiota bacterium]
MNFTELRSLYGQPFFELVRQAHNTCLSHWKGGQVQLCTLLSIKTGGCSEDCGYCAQSARYHTGVRAEKLLSTGAVLEVAHRARANGSTRFCMGAAWKGVREGDPRFEQVIETIREVSKLGMEVCVTLGQLSLAEARRLKEAGVTAYNHNLDTSPEFYPAIVTTHTFQDRLDTIAAVQQAGLEVCCGGIIGMGESVDDRLKMLEVLTRFDPPPESVPINCLMPMPGTPLENQPPVDVFELIRLIATTRLALPKANVRLSAGRTRLSREAQAWCFFAGANSIFYGDKLLTAENPGVDHDQQLLAELDLVPQPPRAGSRPGAMESAATRSYDHPAATSRQRIA